MIGMAEYIWLDGYYPTQGLRSKARSIGFETPEAVTLESFPMWGFDGSSTQQAEGKSSDCLLKPVYFVNDPIRGTGNFLVMCEVLNVDETPHVSNTRAKLREVMDAGGAQEDPWCGFEQEYTLFDGTRPLDWPVDGYPAPQGPYYCGVGATKIFGRPLVEAHTKACIEAGIVIYGINAEVMPSQWEFQIGYRDVAGDKVGAMDICDQVWLGRWLLNRLGEDFGITVSYDPKPVKGDWNGAGMHTNFSTKSMRAAKTGKDTVTFALENLAKTHLDHIAVYGDKNAERLTGAHETCHISQFRYGQSDRGASIRIPTATAKNGYGYIEDRRPAANADPYLVAARLIQTVCDIKLSEPVMLRKVA
jgi:glutamine synthetase